MTNPYAERFRRRYGITVEGGSGKMPEAVRIMVLNQMRNINSARARNRYGPAERSSGTVEWYLAELDDVNARPYWGRVLRKLKAAELRTV